VSHWKHTIAALCSEAQSASLVGEAPAMLCFACNDFLAMMQKMAVTSNLAKLEIT
jgi:hypothetical protein